MKKLENNVAVVYGNGAVGGAMAKAFAKEGAKVFLVGRTKDKLESIANEILSTGGVIEIAQHDVLDEKSIENHMSEVVNNAGRIDISFNAIGIPQQGIERIPLTELSCESFSLPITIYTRSHFITAKLAATRMMKQGQGVILMHTANASHISLPFVGGMAPAWAAMEALCRSLSVECGAHGVRAVCLMTTAIPETPVIDEVIKINAKRRGITFEQFRGAMEDSTHRKKLTTLKELANAAVFAASDEGSAITGSVFNLTAGMIVR